MKEELKFSFGKMKSKLVSSDNIQYCILLYLKINAYYIHITGLNNKTNQTKKKNSDFAFYQPLNQLACTYLYIYNN